MADFLVDYNDFSGGLFVGNNDAKQPKNTFSGDNMLTCEVDGTMMPAAAWVPRSDANVVISAPKPATGIMRAFTDGTYNVLMSVRWDNGALNIETIDNTATHHAWDVAGRTEIITFFSSGGGFCRTGSYIGFFDGGGGFPRMALYSGAITNATTPTALTYPTVYGAFTVGASGSKIYWSNAADPTTWPSANFLQVGGTAYNITAMLVLGQSLMVGKLDGWWQITGVLGENETSVQVSAEGPPGVAAVAADGVLAFPGRLFDGSAVRMLRGSVVPTLAYQPGVSPTYNNVYEVGGYLLATGAGGSSDEIIGRSPTGKWFHLNGAHQLNTRITGFASASAYHAFAYAHLGAAVATGFPYRMLLAPINPPMNAGATAFTSATATLADFQRTTRFRIKSVVAELDLGTTTIDANRSIGVQMFTPGQAAEGALATTTFSSASSTLQTVTLPAIASTAGERVTVRFTPTDGNDTYSMIPQITLQGVKLRRLLVRCQDVPAGGGG